jgi:hypothetical protein
VKAAVEFGKGVVVIPVAIVYIDKSSYRSRVRGSLSFSWLLADSFTRVDPR